MQKVSSKFLLSSFLILVIAIVYVKLADIATFLAPLREARAGASDFDIVTRVLVFLLSLALFFIALIAYQKSSSKKFLFVALAFFLFAFKWSLKVTNLFIPGNLLTDPVENVFELFILGMLVVAIFKK